MNIANATEQRYTDAARLVQGLAAIKHLVENSGPDVRRSFEDLIDTATGEESSWRGTNLIENDWAYGETGEGQVSPLIHPDYTDPSKRRAVIVGIIDAEEGDLHIETVGPFPMAVENLDDTEDPEDLEDLDETEQSTATVILNEGQLLDHFHTLYGGAMTTIRPALFATQPGESRGEKTEDEE